VSCPAVVLSGFKFSAHICSNVGVTVAAAALGAMLSHKQHPACMCPQRNLSTGVKSGKQGGQVMGPHLPIYFHEHFQSIKSCTFDTTRFVTPKKSDDVL